MYNRRIIVAVPVEFHKKCLLVPMLVDTGAPSTYLHTIAVEKFIGHDVLPSSFDVRIGKVQLKAQLNPCCDENVVTGFLNILGMDFLVDSVPLLLPWLSDELSKVQSRVIPTCWVQLVDSPESAMKPSNATAFEVAPTRNDIDSLKDAVKAKIPEKLVGIASIDLKVYARIAEGVWEEVPRASTPLTANTEDSAYHVVVQKP